MLGTEHDFTPNERSNCTICGVGLVYHADANREAQVVKFEGQATVELQLAKAIIRLTAERDELRQLLYEAQNPMLPNGETITVGELYTLWQRAEADLRRYNARRIAVPDPKKRRRKTVIEMLDLVTSKWRS